MLKSALSLSRERKGRIDLEYLYFEPVALDVPQPLIIYLHGAGHKGTSLEKLASASLTSLLSDRLELPAHVICPLAKLGPGWMVEDIAVLVQDALRMHGADSLRVYITGESMGGRGTFEVLYWHTGLFAAAVPICAFGIPNLAPLLKQLPLWIFHGENDDVLPVHRAREMVGALKSVDASVTYSELAGQGHDIARSVYADRQVWDWLLAQKRATISVSSV